MSGNVKRPSPALVISMVALFVALSGASYAAVKADTIGAKQIKSNGVRADEIQDGSVGSSELGDNSVTGSEVLNGSLGSGDVQDGSLNGGDVLNDSLGSADVQDDSLGSADVQNDSLGSADVQDGSLGSADVQDGSLTGGDVQDDSLGSADVAGLGGGDIQAGTFLGGAVTAQLESAAAPLADNTSDSYTVHCPAGQTALGGGGRGDATDSEFTNVTSSRPVISTTNSGAPVDGGTFSGWRLTVLNPTGGAPPGGDILPDVWVFCSAVA